MKTLAENIPVVLACSGHDPTGAAGVQADMEAITRNGARCVSLITTLTAQNTACFKTGHAQPADRFRQQLTLLLDDITIQACKIGLLGSREIAASLGEWLRQQPQLPVVLDPVLRAGTGEALLDRDSVDGLLRHLLPYTTLLTPNVNEALLLGDAPDNDTAAANLLEQGCAAVLITGADQDTAAVHNVLYMANGEKTDYEWPRLPHRYHGSGCTLSAATAALLARGESIATAVQQAQAYTWQTLQHAIQLGKSQYHPDRWFVES